MSLISPQGARLTLRKGRRFGQAQGRLQTASRIRSMPEMSPAGEDHGDAEFIAGGDDFIIPLGAARLNDGLDPRCVNLVDAVPKREKGVRGTDGLLSSLAGLVSGDVG